jgi:C-terminal processing protease CtpA/Prc
MVVNEFLRYLDVETVSTFGGSNVRFGPYLYQYTSQGEPNDRITELTYTGKIYILTAVQTFSSATDFAAAISDNRLGEIVGETSGNMPTAYGDILSFQTPNAGLVFRVSHKQFFRVDRSKDALPLAPDYEVPADEALEMVYELVN